MGGTDFQTYGFGRDAREAYKKAVADAQWEYGHGGYTGTIAEKNGYVLVSLPPRVSSDKFLRWLELAAYSDSTWMKEDLARLEKQRAPRGQGEAYRKRRAELRKAIKRAERERAAIPKQHEALILEASQVYEDKWGPALAFEVSAAEARKAKKARGLARTRQRVFCFCGIASC